MSSIKDGGSILPAIRSNCGGLVIAPQSDGLTIRDWFAGMALHGYLSSDDTHKALSKKIITKHDVIGCCTEWADLMIAARERKEDE